MSISQRFYVRVRGNIACFTRPEYKVERVSYEVMTPSAARGILEAVLWKPAIRWDVRAIHVLAPIAWCAFRRNEVKSRLNPRHTTPYFSDDDRTQRNTVALRDVDYVVEARFCMTSRAGHTDNVAKFEEMFRRRMELGQHFQQPFLGCREFDARVDLVDAVPESPHKGVDRPLGLMFHDFDYSHDPPRQRFFEARLRDGVVEVPPWTNAHTEVRDAARAL